MFGSLTEKLSGVFSSLVGKGKLSEDNISDAVREVRLALLDADVHYGVVKNFVKAVKEKALGEKVFKSVTPAQQFVKIVHDELVTLMGGEESSLNLQGSPPVVLLCGLQGCGKTTQAVKLAKYLQRKEFQRKPLLVACDLQRPAAIEQLKILGAQAGIPVFFKDGVKDPLVVAKEAQQYAKQHQLDVLIVDTAGRLHIDDELMDQLHKLKELLKPQEILFVANAATGQDAVTTATEFNQRLGISGTILTMLDGDTRGGAAISIREVTGQPLKFEGVGEKLDDLQLFNPRSMADRILGMGDTINLVKKAKEHFDEKEAELLEEKMRKANFTYEDYLKQMQTFRKMGSLKGLMKMLPGAAQLPDLDTSEKEFFKMEAMILSMTPRERQERDELDVSRIKRIAKGSGTEVSEVNKLKKSFKKSKQLFKQMKNGPSKKMLEKLMGGM